MRKNKRLIACWVTAAVHHISAVSLAFLMAITVSCGKPEPHDRLADAGLPPGTQVTPGETDTPVDADLRRELDDACLRISLGKLSLRYDRAGVLVSRRGDGVVRFVDLDGSGEVSVNVARSQLVIDGRSVDGAEFKLLRSHDGTEWYSISANDKGVLVIPAD